MLEDQQIRKWFADHVASHEDGIAKRGGEMLWWRNPTSSIYSIRYLLYGGTLFVDGDCGVATYKWPQKVGLPWVSRCNLDYFASKCVARDGKHHISMAYEYDADEAKKDIERIIASRTAEGLGICPRRGGVDLLEFMPGPEKLENEYEFSKWAEEYAYDVLGDAWYESEIGKSLSMTVQAHYIGLRMAFENLKKSSL